MAVFVVMVTVAVVMVMLARGLRLAGAAGELVHKLDELIRRGMVLAGQVASLDRDGPILQNCQLHFRFHGQTPFRSKSLFSDFTTFCQPIFRQAWLTISRLYCTRSLLSVATCSARQTALLSRNVATTAPVRSRTSRPNEPPCVTTRPRTDAAFCSSARSPAWKSRDTVFTE